MVYDLELTFPSATRERAMIRLHEAEALRNARPARIWVGALDYDRLRLDMRRYGYHKKPLDVLNVPIQCGEVPRGVIAFEWEI